MSAAYEELYRQHAEGHGKIVYFLLGTAASAIAFAIYQSRSEPLHWLHIPIGLAIVFWAISFTAGIKAMSVRLGLLNLNIEHQLLKEGKHPDQVHGEALATVLATARESLNTLSAKVGRRVTVQQWMLLAGAAAYVAGHIARMASLN